MHTLINLAAGASVLLALSGRPDVRGTLPDLFLVHATIRVERTLPSPRSPHNPSAVPSRYEALSLSTSAMQRFRLVLVGAYRRGRAQAFSTPSAGSGAGVPASVSYDFRVHFEYGNLLETGWLHLNAGWLSNVALTGPIVFLPRERQILERALGSALLPSANRTH